MKRRLTVVIILAIVIFVLGAMWLYGKYEVPILMYHSLDESRTDYAVVSEKRFAEQMEFIKKRGYEVISLEELVTGKTTSHNLVAITFDDGYRDNLLAIDILKGHDFPAVIFLIANRVGQPGYLGEKDIKRFLAETRVTIGSHTLDHVYLPEADDTRLAEEIVLSRQKLQERFRVPVLLFSYPCGGYDQRAMEKAREAGYIAACTTNRGFSRNQSVYARRRIKITERDRGIILWAKLSGYYNLFRKPKNPY